MSNHPSTCSGIEGRSRWLPIEGCVNFRDLGGYRNSHGQTVRWRRLFRSDALQDMTPADAAFAINELNIGLVVDLRNSYEAERDGRGPLPELGAEYRRFSLMEEQGFPPFTGGDVANRLFATYQWLIHNSGQRVAQAVNAIGEAECGAVFHCSAGKDRTGLLAALILEVLGIDSETIAADYILTNDAAEGILRRIKAMHPRASPTIQSLAAQPAAFRGFRSTLRRDYGGAEPYLRKHGVNTETLESLRRSLLE